MIQRLLPFLTLIVLFVGLAIASPFFLTNTNLSSVVRQTAVINTMALGMTMVIIAGGIDAALGDIIPAAWVVIRTFPHRRRPVKIAANIALDSEYHAFVRDARLRRVQEVPVSPEMFGGTRQATQGLVTDAELDAVARHGRDHAAAGHAVRRIEHGFFDLLDLARHFLRAH